MIERRLPRPLYVAFRLGEMTVQVLSRFLNAAFFGGSTYQTLSARAYIEKGRGWVFLRRALNALFFWQLNHCREAWETEIRHAQRTLQRASA